METKKKEDANNKQMIDYDVNLQVEASQGFMIIKTLENLILLQDKEKSTVLRGQNDKVYDKYLSNQLSHSDENISIFINSNKTFYPISISCMRYSFAAILADYSQNPMDNEIKTTFFELLKKIKEKIQSRGISFHELFFADSLNDLLFENKDFLKEDSGIFVKKYCILYNEFLEKIQDLLLETNNIGTDVLTNEIKKLADLLVNNERKINMLDFYYLVYNLPRKYSNTNIVLLGEFSQRCIEEFINSDNDLMKNVYSKICKIYEDLNYYELPIKSLPIVECKLGDNHILLLNCCGDLFSFGDGTKGATGNGNRTFHILPYKINFFSKDKKLNSKHIKIEKIACGSRHCLALSSNKSVYSWGFGKNGRLGHGDDKDVFEPKPIETFENIKIEKICAADNYSAAISCVNNLFTWGCGEFNRLGHEANSDEKTPKLVPFFSNDVIDVKCGYYSLLVLQKSNLYSVGSKTLFNKKRKNEENKLFSNIPFLEPCLLEGKISQIHYSFNTQKRNLISFASGFNYITILLQDIDEKESNNNTYNQMKVFLWGNILIDELNIPKTNYFTLVNDDTKITKHTTEYDLNSKNIISLKSNKKRRMSYKIKVDESLSQCLFESQKKKNQRFLNNDESHLKKKIKDIICSDNNTVILASDGSLYAFGSSEYKIAKLNVEEYIIPIQPSYKIELVALGKEHIVAVTKNFETYGWGRNIEGQLGLGDGSLSIKEKPCLIDKLKNLAILRLWAKENYTVILDFNKRIYAFGDLNFLDSDSSSAKKTLPKAMTEWGEIELFACGPNHFIFVVDDNGEFQLKCIGNGTYGKLGYDAEKDDNKYTPQFVKMEKEIIQNHNFRDDSEKIKIVCSRRQTMLLKTSFKDKQLLSSKLFVWGLCPRSLFESVDLEKLDRANRTQRIGIVPFGHVIVNIPTLVTSPKFSNVIDIEITDTVFYFINSVNNLEFIGELNPKFENATPNNKIKKEYFLSKNFEKIRVGRDHVIGLDITGKLYSWGNNNFKKLGIKHDNMSLFHEEKDEMDLYKQNNLFYAKPQELTEINKLFENEPIKNTPSSTSNQKPADVGENAEKKQEENKAAGETPDSNKNPNKIEKNNQNANKSELQLKKPDINQNDGLISQIQSIMKWEFDKLEENLLQKEILLKEKMKSILKTYEFLKVNESEAKALKRILFNNFSFRMSDPPLNIPVRTGNLGKYPPEYQKYKKNYKAFLSTLFNHPCYLRNIYENLIINDTEKEKMFYKIIKEIYGNMYQHPYKLLNYMNLLRSIFDVYLLKKKIVKNVTNKKNVNTTKNLFDYSFFAFEILPFSLKIKFNLIYKMIKYFFKQNIEFIKNQELFAAAVLSNFYKKFSSYMSKPDFVTSLDLRKNSTKPYIYENYSNFIVTFFDLITKINDMDALFNMNIPSDKNLFKLPDYLFILVSELAKIVKKHFDQLDMDTIFRWIYKNSLLIQFCRSIKIIQSPKNYFAINSALVIEKSNFRKFFEASKNFESLEYALKFSLLYVGYKDDDKYNFEADDISKKLKNKLVDKHFELANKIKSIMNVPDGDYSKKFDLVYLEEFFKYSLADNNHYINFNLDYMKFLQNIIVNNIDNLRVLNKDFDLLDIIFFNKKSLYYIGEGNGVSQVPDAGEINIQVNLKSRILSNEIQDGLMRCKKCKTICAKEFILANEENFFEEFNYLNDSSKEGRLKKILKNCDDFKKKDFLAFLEEQKQQPGKSNDFKENLYNLFNLIAVNKKEDLYIEESDILNSEKLMQIMLKEKSIEKEIELSAKNLRKTFEDMKQHLSYYEDIESKLQVIEKFGKENKYPARKSIFSRAKDNIERGFSNKDVLNNAHILNSSCKLVILNKENQANNGSKGLADKLSKDKLSKILPYKEFNMKTLKDDKVILEILQKELKSVPYNG